MALIIIVGPTASGKTALSLDLAERFNGEIICADSRTVYREMDIGTAKPTREEQARVPHHLLDVVDPGETLSAGAFKALAEGAIKDIASRGKVPFLVGGSGLYIDAVLFDYQFPAPADEERRKEFENLADLELRELLWAEDPVAAAQIDLKNRRRVIRALEIRGQVPGRSNEPRERTLTLGLGMNKNFVHSRIEKRIEFMLSKGFVEEVRRIGEKYGWESEALSGIGYRAFRDVVLGTKTVDEGVAEFVRGDRALVKKQLTWFKRNPTIRWLDNPNEAEVMVARFLAEADREQL